MKNNTPLWKTINRGRSKSIEWTMSLGDLERQLKQSTSLKIEKQRCYGSKLTFRIWDIGLRPFSPHLAKMANSLASEKRMEIKNE